MGRVKDAYGHATSDDLKSDDPAIAAYGDKIAADMHDIPDEVYREADLSKYTTVELLNEVLRRTKEYET